MEISINTELLQEHGFTVSEYIALYLIWKQKAELIDTVCDDVVFSKLEEKGWMKLYGTEITDWVVRDKFLALVTDNFSLMWYELCATKPFKVRNGKGGYRVLRARDPDAATNDKCKDMYKKIVGTNKVLHKHIMKCVEAEMKATDISFMQNTETWLRQKTWQKFEDLISGGSEENANSGGYGGDVF